MSKILGISAFYHDSAAAILVDGEIIAAAQEERFTREKHYADFPSQSVTYCLREASIDFTELDAIVFYDKPFLKFERLLETYFRRAPRGFVSFLNAMPIWLNKKLFLKALLRKELRKLGMDRKTQVKLLFSEHHLSHAASAFYPSPFKEAAVVTIDGVGEWATATIGKGSGSQIEIIKEMHFPHSVGLLYSAFTYFLGFRVNSGEYKLMGLAPYGNKQSEQTATYRSIILNKLVSVFEDGSVWLNQEFFSYTTKIRMIPDGKWESLFGFVRRMEGDPIEIHHCNLALAIQDITEMIVMRMAKEAKRITGSENLCLAGGVALNCVANGKLERAGIFENIWIQPAAGDAGGSVGAALAVFHMYFRKDRMVHSKPDGMKWSYLGPGYSAFEIELMNSKFDAKFRKFDDEKQLLAEVADSLKNGAVVGWFQGRMEFGPRALGHRSILANPAWPGMQKILNEKIKKRETFRPFAPIILEEDVSVVFDGAKHAPYMLTVYELKEEFRKDIPKDYMALPAMEKLYTDRSSFQAITHVDFSARVQTLSVGQNEKLHALLSEVKQRTGTGMLVNTSFNVRGEPIVCSPEDAYDCFMNTDMDYLVIDNYLYRKSEQENTSHSKSFPKD